MNAALATLPILVTLGLLAARVRALYAALAALATAVVVTLTSFRQPAGDLGRAELHMLPTVVELAAILFGGILLSELMSRTGTQKRLGDWIGGSAGTAARAVLLVQLGVTPFAESLTGFGIGVVVAIPLLRQLGLSAPKAAVVGLLGLVTVPWGSLAPGSLVAAELGGVEFQELGINSALLSAPVFLIAGAAALVVAFGPRRALAATGELVLAAGTLWLTVWAVDFFVGMPLAGVLGGITTVVVLLLVSRLGGSAAVAAARTPLGRALVPYGFLVGGLLLSRLALGLAGIEEGWWAVLAGPAGWLLLTAALTPGLLGTDGAVLPPATRATFGRWWQVTLTTVVFLALGTLLAASGMSRALADAGAALGVGYLLLAPWIGAVGGFLAGSNTGANAMFASSQAATAQLLNYPAAQLVAVQNVSAALASGGAVARVVLAAQLAENAPGPSGPAAADAPSGGVAVLTETATVTAEKVDTTYVLRTVLSVHALIFLVLGVIAVLWR
ncbi:L-lactate permease [Kitasatospora sp. NPDC004289]